MTSVAKGPTGIHVRTTVAERFARPRQKLPTFSSSRECFRLSTIACDDGFPFYFTCPTEELLENEQIGMGRFLPLYGRH